MAQATARKPTLTEALVPVIFLIILLFVNVFHIFGDAALDGSNQLILLFSAAVAGIVGLRIGISWDQMHEGILASINAALSSILILLLIGSLAGTWLLSGIVPAMIYYGLEILNPTIFLFAACVISAIVSVATGSSWSTVATVGIALLGIGKAMGMPEGLVGGAIISGAYFGDKMSPLSDTTNLAPAMAGTELFTHIRHMAWTSGPAMGISLVIFLVIGFNFEVSSEVANISEVQTAILQSFRINGWLFLVPVIVIVLIVKKMPALPALLIGTLLGALFAIFFQQQVVMEVAEVTDNLFRANYVAVMKAMYTTITIRSENLIVQELLSTGGMEGMLNTIWLIICAMVFGGVMESAGLLQRITEEIIKWAHSTGSLVASTAGTCIFFNLTASDQYLAIVVPGRMYADTYRKRGLKPENLSRTLEDAGTATSVLVPWNTCGATQAAVLGVATVAYLPYCFFNILSPVLTVLYGYLNIKINRFTQQKSAKTESVLDV